MKKVKLIFHTEIDVAFATDITDEDEVIQTLETMFEIYEPQQVLSMDVSKLSNNKIQIESVSLSEDVIDVEMEEE